MQWIRHRGAKGVDVMLLIHQAHALTYLSLRCLRKVLLSKFYTAYV